MRRFLLVIAAALVLPSAAHAEPAGALVGRLVRDGCMPIIKAGKMPKKPELPEGGVLLSASEKAALHLSDEQNSRAWAYQADTDRVVLELNKEGCNVFAVSTGDESYLKAVEAAVGAKHPRFQVERDEPTVEANLRNRTYAVPWAEKRKKKGAIQKLDITYSTAAAAPGERMFFVGVLPSLVRER
jgi:hypothetical protein